MDLEKLNGMDNYNVIEFLMDNKLLKEQMCCESCGSIMKLEKCVRNIDGLSWRCRIEKSCITKDYYVSIRKGSFFEGTTKSLKKLIILLYYWSSGMKQTNIQKFCKLGQTFVTKIVKSIRIRVKNYFDINPLIFGGPNKLVQIDETMLNHKIKAHRGRSFKKQVWALVIVDCSEKPAKGFICLIKDKSAKTIIPIIEKHVRIGSKIFTDEAKVYKKLKKDSKFIHNSVVHKYKFVDYETMVHTQNVESYNNKVKMRIKELKGLKEEAREWFCYEFMWLDNFKNECFEKTIELIKI